MKRTLEQIRTELITEAERWETLSKTEGDTKKSYCGQITADDYRLSAKVVAETCVAVVLELNRSTDRTAFLKAMEKHKKSCLESIVADGMTPGSGTTTYGLIRRRYMLSQKARLYTYMLALSKAETAQDEPSLEDTQKLIESSSGYERMNREIGQKKAVLVHNSKMKYAYYRKQEAEKWVKAHPRKKRAPKVIQKEVDEIREMERLAKKCPNLFKK